MPGISIEVDLADVEPLIARLDVAPFVMEQEAAKAMEEATDGLARVVKALTPVETGYLQTSIKAQASVRFEEVRGEVFTKVRYAPFVEEGHGEILPHAPRKFLRFRPRGHLDPVYARRVRPVAGEHMFRFGLDAAMPYILERFRAAART